MQPERPRRPMYVAEHEFLIGDGSLAGAIAGHAMRFVYDDHGDAIRADEWRDHMRATHHEATAFELQPDYITDCIVIIDGPAVWPPDHAA